jgi:quercetin dioxygenase-like cupin family protein
MVEYQPGSIVSRTILNKPSGSVTLFSFDAGESLSEHTAPFDAMVFILDGEALVTIAGQPHTLRAGETILMPAGQPHALQAVNRFKMLLVMIMS